MRSFLLGTLTLAVLGCDTTSAAVQSPDTIPAPAEASPPSVIAAADSEPSPPHTTAPAEPAEAAAPTEPIEPIEPAHARHADMDPDNDDILGPPPPLEDCHERLADLGVTFKPARIGVGKKRDGVFTCGAKQVVRYRGGPEEIKYSTAPLLTCGMAIAFADFERIVQEEAVRELGSRVKKIDHLGTYNCRKMVLYDFISEHSYANGIDLRRFHLDDGREITVFKHFTPKVADADAAPEARFLRRVAERLYDEDVFSVVITPYFDHLHRNHMHVDLARYRTDGTRRDG